MIELGGEGGGGGGVGQIGHFCHRVLLRSRGNLDVRMTESRNARSEQLLMMPIEQLPD